MVTEALRSGEPIGRLLSSMNENRTRLAPQMSSPGLAIRTGMTDFEVVVGPQADMSAGAGAVPQAVPDAAGPVGPGVAGLEHAASATHAAARRAAMGRRGMRQA